MMVSSLQFISYLSLIRISFPANLMIFIDYLNTVHNYNSMIPNVFSYFLVGKDISSTAYNAQFAERGILNCNMLILVGGDFEALFGTMIVLFCLNTFMIPNKFLLRTRRRMKYSSVLRTLFQSYMKFCIAAFVNVGVVQ